MKILQQRILNTAIAAGMGLVIGGIPLISQQQPAPAKPAASDKTGKAGKTAAKGATPAADSNEFFLHAFHARDLGLDCSTCHVPEKEGSVVLKRPGHEVCMACHDTAFTSDLNQKICSQCHSAFPPSGGDDVLPFPRFLKTRAILFQFSQA